MSRKQQPFPWRVVAVSAALFLTLALIGWLLFAGSTPPSPPAGEPGSEGGTTPAAAPGEPESASPPVASGAEAGTGNASLAAGRAAAGTMELRLFMIVPGFERLVPVSHTVTAPATLDAQVRRAVQELIDWNGTDTTSPVPPEARLREAWVSPAGIAYLDFYRSLYDAAAGGSLGELHTVYGIVATVMVSFPEIAGVQFLMEGEQLDTLAGHVDLSQPLRLSSEWVLLEPGRRQMPPSDEPH